MANSKAYLSLAKAVFNKEVDFDSDGVKVALLSSAYTPNQTAHDYFDDVSAYEVSGTGYTAGGQALTSVALTTTGTTTTLTCANPAWANSTITAAFAVFYDASGGTDATNLPVVFWDLGGSQSSSAGTFTLTINGSGLYQVSSSF